MMPLEMVSDVEDDELPDVEAVEEETVDESPAEEAQTEETDSPEESGEVEIGFSDEEAESEDSDTPVLRELRKQNRQLVSTVRKLESQLKTPAKAEEDELGPEPSLADSDFDEEVFKKKLVEWVQKKSAQEASKKQREEAEAKAQDAYRKKVEAYKVESLALGVKDFSESESSILETLSPMQQSILVKHMSKPAAFVYALGKSQTKLKELASITDPIEFALAANRLEEKVKVTKTKSAPPPERVVQGSSKLSAGSYSRQLEALQAEADRTGDRTKVARFLKKQQGQ